MDDSNVPTDLNAGELEPRPPRREDLEQLCGRLNELGARYVVIGGFAIIAAGHLRTTGDIDLLIDSSLENESLAFQALEVFEDKAVRLLDPGDVAKYNVVRVADEVVVDLLHSSCGINYEEAARDLVFHSVGGVRIPFASPRLLWRMKKPISRIKDLSDLQFLEAYFKSRGEEPPPTAPPRTPPIWQSDG